METSPSHHAAVEKRLTLFAVLLFCLKSWLVLGLPLNANSFYIYDDYHYLTQAAHLLTGEWLGPYDYLTLIKGPFYPLWIAIASLTGLPLVFAQHLLYAFAAAVFVRAIRPAVASPWARWLLFAVLLFNPLTYSYGSVQRVVREGVYPALSLLTLAAALALALRRPVAAIGEGALVAGGSGDRKSQSTDPGYRPPIWPWSLLLGLSFAAFWLTREEGLWLLPPLALLLAASLWQDRRSLPHWARTRLPAWGLAGLVALLLVLAVCFQNYRHYGVFNKTELDDPAFRAAYGALIRVRPEAYRQYIPVSAQTRRKVYAVSPAFAELQPYLEGDSGRAWGNIGHYTPVTTGEIQIFGGAFIWAFRDAIRLAGYYDHGAYPAGYYRRLAAEIVAACADRRLDCYPVRASLAPPLRREHLRPFLSAIAASLRLLSALPAFSAQPAGSLGDLDGLRRFQDLTNSLPSGAGVELRVQGWAYDTRSPDNSALTLRLGLRSGTRLPLLAVERAASPELYQELLRRGQEAPAAQFAGFTLAVSDHARPHLLVYRSTALLMAIPLEPGMPPAVEQVDGIQVGIQSVTRTELYPQRLRLDRLRRSILGAIGRLFQIVTLPAMLLSAAAYAALTLSVVRRRAMVPGWLVPTALLAALAARIGLLALIDASSFISVTELYLAPAYPLFLAWMVVCLAEVVHLRRPRMARIALQSASDGGTG